MKKDTIAAIATAMSNSGIGIVRISGEESFQIIDKIYKNRSEKILSKENSHTIHYGYIYDGEELIDEVLVMLMRNPHSYTGEDTIEINCHGGVYVVKRILETVIKYGARQLFIVKVLLVSIKLIFALFRMPYNLLTSLIPYVSCILLYI